VLNVRLFHQYQEHDNHLNEDEQRDEQERSINTEEIQIYISLLHTFDASLTNEN
jgi:hypothetical protein